MTGRRPAPAAAPGRFAARDSTGSTARRTEDLGPAAIESVRVIRGVRPRIDADIAGSMSNDVLVAVCPGLP